MTQLLLGLLAEGDVHEHDGQLPRCQPEAKHFKHAMDIRVLVSDMLGMPGDSCLYYVGVARGYFCCVEQWKRIKYAHPKLSFRD